MEAAGSSGPVKLRGVVFDMDGTLTVPNLDFGEMYRRAGVPKGEDILSSKWRQDSRANAVVEEMELEGRRTLQLMPGAAELAAWLNAHQIPVAMVTRNSEVTVKHFHEHVWPAGLPPLNPAISRDDVYPPKPDPAAFAAIVASWGLALGPEVLMVGDSPSNDVAFGKAAGARTALLDTGRRYAEGAVTGSPDFCVAHLALLAGHLWHEYDIDSPICNLALHVKRPSPVAGSQASVAAMTGDVSMLQSLSVQDLSAADSENGNTPLIWASDAGHVEVVKLLLGAGVDCDARGFLGATPLSRAARHGHVAVLQALFSHGANPDIPNDKLQYAFHFAAFKQKPEAVDVFIECGASPFVLDRKGRTPAEDTNDPDIKAKIKDAQRKLMSQ